MTTTTETVVPPEQLPLAEGVPPPPFPVTLGMLGGALPKNEAWKIPTEAASVLKDIDAKCSEALIALGRLEADYAAAKARLLNDLQFRRDQFKTLIDDTGRKGGLNIDTARWTINFEDMTLNKAS